MTETLARPVVPAAEERARLKEGVHIERSSRRVRTYFGGKLIADSEHVLLVYETKRPPAYWFPIADVRMEYLEASHQAADTIRWHLVVKDRITHNAARAYLKPTDDRAALEGHLTFFWDKMDAWFEEDEQIFVHPRDPYTRVDTVHSSRHVRVEIDGVTLGETRRPMLLFETGLPTLYCELSMSRAARIREWRATGRLGWATSSSRTSCGVIRRQFPSARRLKTCSVSTTSTSTCTSMGCCKIDQSRRSLNVSRGCFCYSFPTLPFCILGGCVFGQTSEQRGNSAVLAKIRRGAAAVPRVYCPPAEGCSREHRPRDPEPARQSD